MVDTPATDQTTTTSRPIWERRDGESLKAYAAFAAYLGLGIDRSLIAAYRLYSGNETATATPGWFGAWSSGNDWKVRAEAFDQYELEDIIAKREQVRERARQRIVNRLGDLVERALAVALGDIKAPGMVGWLALQHVMAQAGVVAPKQVEHSGRGGGPIETKNAVPLGAPPGPLTDDELAEVAAIIQESGALEALLARKEQSEDPEAR